MNCQGIHMFEHEELNICEGTIEKPSFVRRPVITAF